MTQGFRQKELTTRVLHANQATFKFSHRDEKYILELSGASQCGRGVKNLVWFRSVLRCDPTTKKYFAVSYNALEGSGVKVKVPKKAMVMRHGWFHFLRLCNTGYFSGDNR